MANAKEARIEMYMHCKTCVVVEIVDGKKTVVDKGEKLAFGMTKQGFQVVCENCGLSVVDLDLLGQKITYYNPSMTQKDKNEFLNEIKSGKAKPMKVKCAMDN